MLALTRVAKVFGRGTPNEVRALQGVDLTIEEGSFVIVIGTNGSGKSTLLNAIAGTFFVDSGSIELDGRDITAWPEHRRARLVAGAGRRWYRGSERARARIRRNSSQGAGLVACD